MRWLAAAALVGACGGGSAAPPHPDSPIGSGSDAAGSADAGSTWSTLISRSWMLQGTGGAAYAERWECIRTKVTSDVYISGFRELAPAGTDELTVTVTANDTGLSNGSYDCSAAAVDTTMVYAAGLGTDDLEFPDGMAVHLTAGQYINLNIHLYQTGMQALSATSGVLVETVPAASVSHELDMFYAGTRQITLPSQGGPQYASGGCAATAAYNVIALWPHMRALGTHQKLAAGSQTLLDADFTPTAQTIHPIAPTQIANSTSLLTTCTYVNTTGTTVGEGDSATQEACFTGIYEYPSGNTIFSCVN
ncbi:MAG TPA: hypothetical protein VGF94_22725 [Kofleriaceae bacterium]